MQPHRAASPAGLVDAGVGRADTSLGAGDRPGGRLAQIGCDAQKPLDTAATKQHGCRSPTTDSGAPPSAPERIVVRSRDGAAACARTSGREGLTMIEEVVRSGEDKLSGYADRSALEALAELIWNALDAEADKVTVDYDVTSLDSSDALHSITKIRVEDNGLGFTRERAQAEFLSHGDSWKKLLNGLTPNGKRVSHGRQGRGRFFAYSLGHRVTWRSVSASEVGQGNRALTVAGDRATINRFTIGEEEVTEEPTGTSVTIRVEQGRSLSTLLKDDAALRLSALFAPHLLGNADIEVRVDGKRLDPLPLLDAEPVDITLDDCPADEIGEHDAPVLRIIEWKKNMRAKVPTLLFCNGGGATLSELPASDPDNREMRRPGVNASCYLMWDGFASDETDLLTLRMRYPTVVDSAIVRFREHLDARFDELLVSIVQKLKDEGSYPYSRRPRSKAGRAEQDLYDVLLVTAQPALGGNQQQRALGAKLLHLAVSERPEALDRILGEVLSLDDEIRDELAEVLKRSTFPAIITSATEVARRIDLLTALRRLLYESEESKLMREVDQLHPLVRDNTWLFDEHWNLTRSETSLTNVLRAVIPDSTILEEELDPVRRADGTDGRVDLLLHRDLRLPDGFRRLVVELKRPSKVLDFECLNQVKSYAQALAASPAIGTERWEFWLVGTKIHAELEGDIVSSDRARGHVVRHDRYDVWVVEWGDLIDQRLLSLDFVRSQLDYEVDQGDALERLGERYGSRIPGWQSDEPDDLEMTSSS